GNTGGPPLGSQNHYIHGFYSKLLPKQTYDIFKEVNKMDPLDMLWHSIGLKFSAILRAQKIMYVKNKNDKTVEKVGYKKFDGELSGESWEVQQAWEKQAQFLKAQSDAMGQLSKMIRNYEEMLHKNWDVATELQKTRVEVLKQKLKDPELGKNKLEDFM
ncbi:MAG TPA: terminase, partial [Negativicutes bacterium]|nr:terminase [Negativicutes bacterium]